MGHFYLPLPPPVVPMALVAVSTSEPQSILRSSGISGFPSSAAAPGVEGRSFLPCGGGGALDLVAGLSAEEDEEEEVLTTVAGRAVWKDLLLLKEEDGVPPLPRMETTEVEWRGVCFGKVKSDIEIQTLDSISQETLWYCTRCSKEKNGNGTRKHEVTN